MKRTPLQRKTGFSQRTPLLRSSALPSRSVLSRGPIKTRSAKTAAAAPKRQKLRRKMLDGNPLCERCQAAFATDLHELLRRSQGGDPLAEAGIVVLCRECHRFVTENPAAGHAEGWVRWSWERRGYGGAA